jgi:hypothetical protein
MKHCRGNSADRDRQAAYQRRRDLPRLLPLWPHEIEPATLADHARLLARMRRALRLERQRGIAGHWTYDLARHAALLRAYRAETEDYLLRSRAAAADNR